MTLETSVATVSPLTLIPWYGNHHILTKLGIIGQKPFSFPKQPSGEAPNKDPICLCL